VAGRRSHGLTKDQRATAPLQCACRAAHWDDEMMPPSHPPGFSEQKRSRRNGEGARRESPCLVTGLDPVFSSLMPGAPTSHPRSKTHQRGAVVDEGNPGFPLPAPAHPQDTKTVNTLKWTEMSSQPLELRRAISKVKQACDCCHARKIRCDGEDPCANCSVTQLRCSYLLVHKKTGPKGQRVGRSPGMHRGRTERLVSVNGIITARRVPAPIVPRNSEQGQLPADNSFDQTFGFEPSPLCSPDIIRRCVDGFFAHKYPIMPILDRKHVYASLPHLRNHPEQYGLITALCAAIILQPEILGPPGASEGPTNADQLPSSELFISETCRSRRHCNPIETPTLATVQTSFFLFAALFSTGKDNSAWFYIREAMTMLQLQRFHEEDTYSAMTDPQYMAYCRRTFWLLFITERAYALQRHRPLTLQRTIDLPTVSPGPEAKILSGFLDLVSLFQNIDDTFLSLWNLSSANSTPSLSPSPPPSPLQESLLGLQDILKFSLLDVSDRTEIQQADLLVSRQWLKIVVWQLCVGKRLLSSSTTNESMSFRYPVTIARDVILISRLLPPKAFEANGVGILEKVFDIGWSLADVLLVYPGPLQVSSLEVGPKDCLMGLVRILATVYGGSSKYLTLLATRTDECHQFLVGGSLLQSESSDDIEGTT
jgi:hypothetical protein